MRRFSAVLSALAVLASSASADAARVELSPAEPLPAELIGQTVTLRFYDRGAAAGSGDIDDLVYMDEAAVSESSQTNDGGEQLGEVKFTFDFNGSGGYYPYIMRADAGGWSESGTLLFRDEQAVDELIKTKIAEALKSDEPGKELKKAFEDNSEVLYIDENFEPIANGLASYDTTPAYDMLAKKVMADTDFETLSKEYKKAMLLYAVRYGTRELIRTVDTDYYDMLGIDNELIIKKYTALSDSDKLKVSDIEKGAYDTAEDYAKAHAEATALGVLNAASQWQELKKEAEELNPAADLGMPLPISNDAYQQLSLKRPFSSKQDLAAKVTAAVKDAAASNSTGSNTRSTGGGGGGGGSTVSFGMKTDDTVTPKQEEIMSENDGLTFTDLGPVTWARDAIAYLVKKGAVSGRSTYEFAPEDNITREEFVKILTGALEIVTDAAASEFSDVPEGSWYKPYVDTAVGSGVVLGMGDGRFGTGENITRQDAAVMIVRALEMQGRYVNKQSAAIFGDNSRIADYAVDSVSALVNAGAVSGTTDGNFLPLSPITRAETAKIIYAVIK